MVFSPTKSQEQILEEIVRSQRELERSLREFGGVKYFDLVSHLHRARAFSEKAFGPASRPHGVIAHIRKELEEIEAEPHDLEEWIDVMILAMDGAWRAGYEPEEIVAALAAKQTKNEGRAWPDWRTIPEGQPIEHDRSGEYDAILKNVRFVDFSSGRVMVGNIFADKRGRYAEGAEIQTSYVVSQNGDIVKTRNTTYKIEEAR